MLIDLLNLIAADAPNAFLIGGAVGFIGGACLFAGLGLIFASRIAGEVSED